MSDSLWHHGLSSARLLCPWNYPAKSTVVGYHFLPQGIFPTRDQTESPALQADSLPLSHLGSPSVSLTPHNDPPAEPVGSTVTEFTTQHLSPVLYIQPSTPPSSLPDGFLQLPPTWTPASITAQTSGSCGHNSEYNCQKHEFHWWWCRDHHHSGVSYRGGGKNIIEEHGNKLLVLVYKSLFTVITRMKHSFML